MVSKEMFHFENCLSCPSPSDYPIDMWGAAFVWFKGNEYVGVEYNFCIQESDDCSAIYKLYQQEGEETLSTDYSVFEGYNIDFNDSNWEEKLKDAMIGAFCKFFPELIA